MSKRPDGELGKLTDEMYEKYCTFFFTGRYMLFYHETQTFHAENIYKIKIKKLTLSVRKVQQTVITIAV